MTTAEPKPSVQWLIIALAVVCVGCTAVFLVIPMPVEYYIAILLAGCILAAAVFFLLRLILRSSKMPPGWADPIFSPKRIRKEMDLPEKEAEARTTPGEKAPEFISDTGKVEDEQLAGEFMEMGRLLLKSGRYGEAKGAFKRAAHQDPGNSKVYNYLGISCGRLSQCEEAVDAYNKAIALDYDYASAHFNLASVYDQMCDTQNAIAQWQRYLDVGQVVGEREDMLERARDRLQCLKNGTDKIKKPKTQPPAESGEESSD